MPGVGVFVGAGGPLGSPAPPPLPTAGQTNVWRLITTQDIGTVDAAGDLNLDTYSGVDSYIRRDGPRYGPAANPTWTRAEGLSLHVPVNGAAIVVNGRKDLSANTAYKNCGMLGGWVNITAGSSSYKRIFGTRGTVGLGSAPFMWFGGRVVGTDVVCVQTDSVVSDLGNPTTVGSLNQWIWLQLAWEYSAPTFTRKWFYKTVGGTLTQLGTTYNYNGDVRIYTMPCFQATNNGSLDDISGGTQLIWRGSFHAYECTNIAAASLYPNDVREPSDSPITHYVSGSAGGGGIGTSGSPWTAQELANELDRRTAVRGSYRPVIRNGSAVAIPANATQANNLKSYFDDGSATFNGDRIVFSGNELGEVEVPTQLNFENTPGVRLGGTAKLTCTTLMDGYTRPNAGTYPNVWQHESFNAQKAYAGIAGTNVGATIEIDGILCTPVGVANLAAAYATLNTTPYTCFTDANGIYFYSAVDPNSDGITRKHSLPTNQSGAVGNGLISLGYGEIESTLTLESGMIWQYSNNAVVPHNTVTISGGITVISGTHNRGSFHQTTLLSSILDGFIYRKDMTCTRFCYGGGYLHTDFINTNSNSTGYFTFFDNVVETNKQLAGQAVTTSTVGDASHYSHTNAATTNFVPTFIDTTLLGPVVMTCCIGATGTVTNSTAGSPSTFTFA